MTFPLQLDKIDSHVRDVIAKGAGAHRRRARPGDGRYYLPTILVDVDHSMLCMREETFGPTFPVMRLENLGC